MTALGEFIYYVISAPNFYWAMGFTAATGVFAGGIVFNGNFKLMSKGLFTLLSYVFFVAYANIDRILDNRAIPLFDRHPASLAATITLLVTALFYSLGMIIGVTILNYKKKNR
jgi:hypothetical protein